MASAYYENTGGLIRVWTNPPVNWKPGDPGYDFSVDVVGDEGAAILKGLVYPGFTHEHRDAIRKVLLDAGFTHYARWRHREGEEPKFIRIKL